jgi:hypothetical protein
MIGKVGKNQRSLCGIPLSGSSRMPEPWRLSVSAPIYPAALGTMPDMDVFAILEAAIVVLLAAVIPVLATIVVASPRRDLRLAGAPVSSYAPLFTWLLFWADSVLFSMLFLRATRNHPILFIASLVTFSLVTGIIGRRTRTARQLPSRFPVGAETTFWLQGSTFRVGEQGVRAVRLLTLMVEARERAPGNVCCLLPYRQRIREVMRAPPRATLVHVAERTGDPALRQLAIWLRGRCRGTLGSTTLAKLWPEADASLRKELTRAFKQMDAWDYLRGIEATDPDPRIRRMARQPAPSSFHGRLAQFLESVAPREASQEETQLVLGKEFDADGGRPAKPDWLIRRILEHIRWLVRTPAKHERV